MKLLTTIGCGAFLIAAALFTVPHASASNEDLRKKYALPTHVQLKPFSAPTTSRRGRQTPVTVFLEAVDRKQTGAICRYLPRIMDAIMTHFHKFPIPVQGRQVNLTGVGERLMPYINHALGQQWVKSVHIVAGMRQMAKGGASRLPFNASGCKGIKDFDAKK